MNTIGRWFFGTLFGLLAMQAHAQYYGQTGYQGQTLVCNSSGYSQTYCSADTRGGVTPVPTTFEKTATPALPSLGVMRAFQNSPCTVLPPSGRAMQAGTDAGPGAPGGPATPPAARRAQPTLKP